MSQSEQPQQQSAYLFDVELSKLDTLRKLLGEMQEDIESEQVLNLAGIASLHFARLVLLPERPAESTRNRLLFAAVHDCPPHGFIEFLLETRPEGLQSVFGLCRDFELSPAWFRRHRLGVRAMHIGAHGFTAKQIRAEAALREALVKHIEENWQELAGFTPQQVYDHLKSTGMHSGIPRPQPGSKVGANFWTLLALALSVPLVCILGLGPLWGTLAVLLIAGLTLWSAYAVQTRERSRGNPEYPFLNPENIRDLKAQENLVTQNCLTFYGPVKPGYRKILVKLILLVAGAVAQAHYRFGQLVRVPTIHFARFFSGR